MDGLPIAVNNQTWDHLDDAGKAAMTTAAVAACDWNNENRVAEEDRLVAFFESEGLKVTTPNLDAFRSHVQEFYLTSARAALWPEGWVGRINALAK